MGDPKHARPCGLAVVVTLASLLIAVPVANLHAGMVRIRVGDTRKQVADFYSKQLGVSRETAERWVRQQEREKGVKVIDDFELPEGTLLDFYKVRNHPDPTQRVEFQGRGRLISAHSYLGRHLTEILFGLLRTDEREAAIQLLRQARDYGFMVVPAALERRAGPVRTAATQTITAIVVAPEFPHWVDPRPTSNGSTSRFDGDMYYETGGEFDLMRRFPMHTNNHGYEEWPADYYADSPGGPINSEGIPLGLGNASAYRGSPGDTSSPDGHPRAGGEQGLNGMPEITLQNMLYDRIFNKGNPLSLTNYYYENSHGHIRIEGDYSNIIGWVHDHHVLDRFPLGGPNYYCVQPGTPLLRPTNPSGPGIVRASLWDGGLTLFFRRDVYGLSIANITLWAYTTADTDLGTSGTQPGIVQVDLTNSHLNMDPWDARRWTVVNDGWQFLPTGGVYPDDLEDWDFAQGREWRVRTTVPAGGPHWYPSPVTYAYQGMGCPDLPDTLFTTADVRQDNTPGIIGSDAGNRLKSFCYYTHNGGDDTFNASQSAYQLVTLRQSATGASDCIAGNQDNAGDRRPRAAPFDHDMYDHNFPNGGGVLGSATPGHTAAAMRADVLQVLNDQGITYTGYDRMIFLYPDQDQSEGNPNASIIPHATGGIITVPVFASLTLLAHELGHTFGMVDLYDNHFYDNNASPPPSPPYFECAAVTPYSVMAFGGNRVDPWHKLKPLTNGPWAAGVPVLANLRQVQIQQVETTLRDPEILKLPAHPLAIYAKKWLDAAPGTHPPNFPGTQADWERLADPDQWQEYFLIENRNRNGGAYFGDPSPLGLYIWHIDERNIGGFQRAEETLTVAVEQADGLYELETNRTSQGPGNIEGDPFRGSTDNTAFTERQREDANGNTLPSPVSWSHGAPEPNQNPPMTVLADTPTDSFVRVVNITGTTNNFRYGNPITADIYVEPAEVIATQPVQLVPPPVPPYPFWMVAQDTPNFPVMLLNLNNDGRYPNLSTNTVTINRLRVREIGTSVRDANIAQAKLFLDTNDNQQLDVNEDDNHNGVLDLFEDRNYNGVLDTQNIDTLLATGPVQNDWAVFNSVGYTIPLNTDRGFIVAYDIAKDAQTTPVVTVGAEITRNINIVPDYPGAVQERERLDGTGGGGPGYHFGQRRFPITGRTAMIVERPDTLYVQSETLAPKQATQGETDVKMLWLELTVDHDAVTVGGINVSEIGTAVGGTDVAVARAYDDADGDKQIDPGEQLLGEAAFIAENAHISGMSYTVVEGTKRHIILAINIAPGATLATPPLETQISLLSGSFDLVTNPNDPYSDQVDYSNFPHTSGRTQIVEKNLPPYPSPDGTWGGHNYDQDWAIIDGYAVPPATHSPPQGAQIVDTTPTFQFPRARGAMVTPPDNKPDPNWYDTYDTISYIAEFSQDPNFPLAQTTAVLIQTPGAGQPAGPDGHGPATFQFQAPQPFAQGIWYWRMRSQDQGLLESVNSRVWQFEILPPPQPLTPPTLIYPINGVVISTVTPTYRWTPGTGGTAPLRVVVEVDDNADFSSLQFRAVSLGGATDSVGWTVEFGSEVLTPGKRYYWRAKMRDAAGYESAWSGTEDFVVGENVAPFPPQPPFDPINDAEVYSARPTLSWGPASDPNVEDTYDTLSYEVQVDTDEDWSDANVWEGTKGPSTENPVTLAVGIDLLDNTHYYWRARTRDQSGLYSDWTRATLGFWVNTDNDPPRKPAQGFSPTNGVIMNTRTPTLMCSQYDSQGKLDPDPFDPDFPRNRNYLTFVFQLRPDNGDWNQGVAYQYTVLANANPYDVSCPIPAGSPLTDGTDWYWRVKAVDALGAESPWSDTQWFRIEVGNSPPTLTPPNNDYTQALTPKYGRITDTFEFRVIYTDAEGDPPLDGVWLELDNDPQKRFFMQPRRAYTRGDYQAGAEYFIRLRGDSSDLTIGWHRFRFFTLNDTVRWPTPSSPTGSGEGPYLDTPSTVRLTDAAGVDVVSPLFYEEGATVFIEAQDLNHNLDPNAAETVTVSVTDFRITDTETVTLTETGLNTAVFRGQIRTLGRAGATDDGVLNIIAGPNGNTVVATYSDSFQGPDCPPAARDVSTDTAPLRDTVAPQPAQPTLIATSGPDGRTLELDWRSYNEASQIDVAQYQIFVEPATFTDVQGLTVRATAPAGTQSFSYGVNIVPDQTYFVAVVPIDEVPNRNTDATAVSVTTRDTNPPTLQNQTPAPGQTDVRVDTNVVFSVVDPGVGINESTLRVTVNGTDVTSALVRTGNDFNRRCEYDPPANFPWNRTITVRVICDDKAGNHMDQSYQFSTTGDRNGPRVTNQSPADGATNVAPTTLLSFHLEDDSSGIDLSSIHVRVNGVEVTQNCGINSANLRDVVVTYPGTPPAAWAWGSTVTVSVSARDVGGNSLVPNDPTTWSFTVEPDNDPPAISNINPAPNQTNVPIDTLITFRLSDAKSGIDQSTLRVYVNGTQAAPGTLTLTGTDASLNVQYTPPTLYNYDQVITVRVFVRDKAGNLILDEQGGTTDGYEWHFTCRGAPRYRITGTVTTDNNAPLPGVIISVYQEGGGGGAVATARSDGNGTFIVPLMLAGTYRLVPSLTEYTFTPTERRVTVTDRDVTDQNFQGSLKTYTIRGRVTENGQPKPGVLVTDGLRTATTDQQGNYILRGVPNGRYTIEPSLANYQFRPPSTTVVVEGGDVANINFEAVANTYTIRGTVRDFEGARVQGVRVTDGTRTSITNEAGQYTLSDVPAGTYAISASKAGYLITPASRSVTVPPDATGVDFTAFVAFTNTFRPGLNFLGVPCYPSETDPVLVFGTRQVARWNPTANPPTYVTPGSGAGQELLQVQPGRGFWVDLPTGQLSIPGRPLSASQPFTLSLGPAWNMVANMFNVPLPFRNITPQVPGTLRPYGYVYDPTTGSYLLVAAEAAINVARAQIFPWEGIWLRTSGAAATASVTPPTGVAAAQEVQPQALDLGADGWAVTIVARAGDREDRTTTVGIAPSLRGAVELDNAPMAPRTVDLFVVAQDGRYLAQDVRTAGKPQTWNLVVCTDLADTPVELSFPDLSRVPNDLAVYLTDMATGKRVYARTTTSVTFTSGATGARRQYKLEIGPRTQGGLVISNAAASVTKGAAVVTFSLSAEAKVWVRITNIAGREIRVLSEGRAAAPGLQTLRWDLKNGTGAPVPNGRYLVQIEGVGEDGQRVQRVATMDVRR